MAVFPVITTGQIDAFRRQVLPPGSISSQSECLAAVDRLGLCWPFASGPSLVPALFPALTAVSTHQCWDWMWGWKDRLSAGKLAYYGKVVGKRPTLVSLQLLPTLYALTGNSGDEEDDLVHVADSTSLSELARKAYRYLQEHGPTGTRTLLAKLTDGSRPMKSALEKGLEQLDQAMLIAKCGTEGGNSIANVWNLFPRYLPEAVEAGTAVATREAAGQILRHYFALTPAVATRSLTGLFPWNAAHQERALAQMLSDGDLVPCSLDGKPGLCRPDLL